VFRATIRSVECSVVREALSARLDGEREPIPSRRVDEHLETCGQCRDWYYQARALTGQLRDLAGQNRPAMTVVNKTSTEPASPRRRLPGDWRRWALATVGVVQIAIALLQAAGLAFGVSGSHGAHGPALGAHLLNESTAWSVAIGVAMVVAAIRPLAAAGLSAVLLVFTVFLTGYVVADSLAGTVTAARILSHLPVLLGTALAVLVWQHSGRRTPDPQGSTASDEILLPQHASRGRRRGHLRPTDDSAA